MEQLPKNELPPMSKPERVEFLNRLIFDFSNQEKDMQTSNEEKVIIKGMLARWEEELKNLEQE